MARPQIHDTDAILDAARDLLLAQGAARATVGAIAGASGAPTGTIYHRFGSRDALLARLWMRAVKRSQSRFLESAEHPDGRRAALGAALSIIDFSSEEPADARLLASIRREDLMRTAPEGAIRGLAERVYGGTSRTALDRTILATFDIPYGATRRYLISGRALPPDLREVVTVAVEAVLAHPVG